MVFTYIKDWLYIDLFFNQELTFWYHGSGLRKNPPPPQKKRGGGDVLYVWVTFQVDVGVGSDKCGFQAKIYA